MHKIVPTCELSERSFDSVSLGMAIPLRDRNRAVPGDTRQAVNANPQPEHAAEWKEKVKSWP